jgi:hypothetical protein
VGHLLSSLGLGEYVEAMQDQGYDSMKSLLALSEEELAELCRNMHIVGDDRAHLAQALHAARGGQDLFGIESDDSDSDNDADMQSADVEYKQACYIASELFLGANDQMLDTFANSEAIMTTYDCLLARPLFALCIR